MNLSMYKAQPTISGQAVEDLIVEITDSMPESALPGRALPYPQWHNEQIQRYAEQGQKLADALVKALPGGTVDQLLRALLQHRASLFIVSFVDEPEGGTPCNSNA